MINISRRRFLQNAGVGLAGVAAASSLAAPQRAQSEPNILFVLTDDQRWDTLGCMGNPVVQTPHLDRLAAEGVLFENAFVTTPVCCVSRASILSGKYARYRGVADLSLICDPGPWEQTYPSFLKNKGYYIGYIGKYNVGTPDTIDRDGLRYDFWAGWQHHGNYWHDRNCPTATNNGVDDKTLNHCTCPPSGELPRVGREGIENSVHTTLELVPQKVRQFLESRDPGAPFCLTVGTKAPKEDWRDYPDSLAGMYEGAEMPIPATATAEAAAALPGFLRASLGSDTGGHFANHHDELAEQTRRYYRCVTALDIAFGKMRDTLEEHGVGGNTVIIFMSDNGQFLADHGLWGKWLGYDPSIRVPAIVCDPRLPSGRRGIRLPEMLLNIDIAPTLLSLAGVPAPDSMQGADITPLLRGEPCEWREDWFFEHTWDADNRIEPSEGVRTRSWKYLRYPRQEPPFEQLFDLESDPNETRNLAAREEARSILKEMRRCWEVYRGNLADRSLRNTSIPSEG